MAVEYFSVNRFPGNGVTTQHEFTFAGGYISKAHVKAYILDAAGVKTDITVTDAMFVGPYTLNLGVAAPVGGETVIYRDTPKATPLVDFQKGARITEANLDKTTQQAVFGVAEIYDAANAAGVVVADVVTAAAAAGAARDAAQASQAAAATSATNAASSATSASTSATNAANSASSASTSATNAASSAAAASSSASGASTSATNAAASATSAANSATAASDSASQAAASAASLDPATIVRTSGDQSIAGTKTFTAPIAGSVTGSAATAGALTTPNPVDMGGTGATTAAEARVNLAVETGATGSTRIASGTTAQRDASPGFGYARANSTLTQMEWWNGSAWVPMGGGATGAPGNAVFHENDQTVTADYTITSGKNAVSAGPITINTGITVTVPTGSTWTVV